MKNQISAQIENKIDIKIQYAQHKDTHDCISIHDQKGVYFIGFNSVEKAISKTEYQEILEMIQKNPLGENHILFSGDYDGFWNKYFHFRENEKIKKIGILLFGKTWKKALSEELNVDERRITHWLQCTRPIPTGVWDDLEKIAKKRKKEVEESMSMLKLSTKKIMS